MSALFYEPLLTGRTDTAMPIAKPIGVQGAFPFLAASDARSGASAVNATAEDEPPAARSRTTSADSIPLPKTRAECRGPGLCPIVRCRYHLLVEVTPRGSLRLTEGPQTHRGRRRVLPIYRASRGPVNETDVDEFTDRAVDRLRMLERSCVLDVIDDAGGPLSYEAIAEQLGVVPEVVRETIRRALRKIRES